MKRIFLLLSIVLSATLIFAENQTANKFAQTGNDRFSVKAQYLMGFYVDTKPHMAKLDPSNPMGISLGIELANHGKPRGGKYSFWGKLIAVIINLLLFYYAGLFDKFM